MLHIKIIKFLHSKIILNKRAVVLSKSIGGLIPPRTKSVLDIGCGDGKLSAMILKDRPKLSITGLEVLNRKNCAIKYKLFKGKKIPFESNSIDLCLLVDVLHHTSEISSKLEEAKRVTKRYIIIKDHIYSNSLDFSILKFMDWVGNRPYGVDLIYNYKKKRQWLDLFKLKGLKVLKWNEDLPLYPAPFNKIFGNKLHFTVLLKKDIVIN